MAKTGLKGLEGTHITCRSIVVDDAGIPWIVDPAKGTLSPATIQVPATKKK